MPASQPHQNFDISNTLANIPPVITPPLVVPPLSSLNPERSLSSSSEPEHRRRKWTVAEVAALLGWVRSGRLGDVPITRSRAQYTSQYSNLMKKFGDDDNLVQAMRTKLCYEEPREFEGLEFTKLIESQAKTNQKIDKPDWSAQQMADFLREFEDQSLILRQSQLCHNLKIQECMKMHLYILKNYKSIQNFKTIFYLRLQEKSFDMQLPFSLITGEIPEVDQVSLFNLKMLGERVSDSIGSQIQQNERTENIILQNSENIQLLGNLVKENAQNAQEKEPVQVKEGAGGENAQSNIKLGKKELVRKKQLKKAEIQQPKSDANQQSQQPNMQLIDIKKYQDRKWTVLEVQKLISSMSKQSVPINWEEIANEIQTRDLHECYTKIMNINKEYKQLEIFTQKFNEKLKQYEFQDIKDIFYDQIIDDGNKDGNNAENQQTKTKTQKCIHIHKKNSNSDNISMYEEQNEIESTTEIDCSDEIVKGEPIRRSRQLLIKPPKSSIRNLKTASKKPKTKDRFWTDAEQASLIQAIEQQNGVKQIDWNKVAECVKSRNSCCCRKKYNYLEETSKIPNTILKSSEKQSNQPNILKESQNNEKTKQQQEANQINLQEEQTFVKSSKQSQYEQGKAIKSVSTKQKESIQELNKEISEVKNSNKINWTVQEYYNLVNLVKSCSSIDWYEVSQQMKTRNAQKCYSIFNNRRKQFGSFNKFIEHFMGVLQNYDFEQIKMLNFYDVDMGMHSQLMLKNNQVQEQAKENVQEQNLLSTQDNNNMISKQTAVLTLQDLTTEKCADMSQANSLKNDETGEIPASEVIIPNNLKILDVFKKQKTLYFLTQSEFGEVPYSTQSVENINKNLLENDQLRIKFRDYVRLSKLTQELEDAGIKIYINKTNPKVDQTKSIKTKETQELYNSQQTTNSKLNSSETQKVKKLQKSQSNEDQQQKQASSQNLLDNSVQQPAGPPQNITSQLPSQQPQPSQLSNVDPKPKTHIWTVREVKQLVELTKNNSKPDFKTISNLIQTKSLVQCANYCSCARKIHQSMDGFALHVQKVLSKYENENVQDLEFQALKNKQSGKRSAVVSDVVQVQPTQVVVQAQSTQVTSCKIVRKLSKKWTVSELEQLVNLVKNCGDRPDFRLIADAIKTKSTVQCANFCASARKAFGSMEGFAQHFQKVISKHDGEDIQSLEFQKLDDDEDQAEQAQSLGTNINATQGQVLNQDENSGQNQQHQESAIIVSQNGVQSKTNEELKQNDQDLHLRNKENEQMADDIKASRLKQYFDKDVPDNLKITGIGIKNNTIYYITKSQYQYVHYQTQSLESVQKQLMQNEKLRNNLSVRARQIGLTAAFEKAGILCKKTDKRCKNAKISSQQSQLHELNEEQKKKEMEQHQLQQQIEGENKEKIDEKLRHQEEGNQQKQDEIQMKQLQTEIQQQQDTLQIHDKSSTRQNLVENIQQIEQLEVGKSNIIESEKCLSQINIVSQRFNSLVQSQRTIQDEIESSLLSFNIETNTFEEIIVLQKQIEKLEKSKKIAEVMKQYIEVVGMK